MKASTIVFSVVLLFTSVAQADDSLNVRLVGSCDTPGDARDLAVSGSYVLVADWNAGLRIISVSDPTHPTEVGHVDAPDSAVSVAVSGDYAYVVGASSGLRVISIVDPAHPIEVGSYQTPGLAYRLAVNGDYAFVADLDSGLWVVSVADPAHPTKVGRWQVPGMVFSIVAVGHFVYVADYYYGLRVVSVAEPNNPREVGHNESLGFAGMAVRGDYAYVGTAEDRLLAVSLADSTHPVEVGWVDTHESVQGVVVDDYAFALGSSWLDVASVSAPANPDAVGYYHKPFWGAHALAASGDEIYVATDSGLSVCQRYDAGVTEAPGVPARMSRCEPTVVRAVLHLGVSTVQNTGCRAELLDAAGRRVLDLHGGANDVSTLAPGVYFIGVRPAFSVRKVIIAE